MTVFSDNLAVKLREHGLILLGRPEIKNFVTFEKPLVIYAGCTIQASNFGAFSYVNAFSSLTCCTVGRYCSLASHVEIGMPRHLTTKITTSSVFYNELPLMTPYTGGASRPTSEVARCYVTLGHDVWIGSHVLIPAHREVRIGTGAVVAAGAVVTKDIPPYAVAAGNPARIKKMRFKDEICADLLASQWWDYNLPYYMSKTCDLPIEAPKLFLQEFGDRRREMPLLSNERFFAIPKSADEVKIGKAAGPMIITP